MKIPSVVFDVVLMCFCACSGSAVDRSVTASLSDARDALINAAIDSLASYRTSVLSIQQPGLLTPACLRLFPLYVLALLKHVRRPTRTSRVSVTLS